MRRGGLQRESALPHPATQGPPSLAGLLHFWRQMMVKPLNQERADTARKAVAACDFGPHEDPSTSIKDPLVDLAHLADAEGLDYVDLVRKAINAWQVERIDPTSLATGPSVDIIIGAEGLPPPPAPKPRKTKPKKVRVPR